MALRDLDPRTAARFDRYLDGLVTGTRESSPDVAPALARIASRLHKAGSGASTAHEPRSARHHAVAGNISAPKVSLARFNRTTIARPVSAITAAAMAVLLVCGLFFTLAQNPAVNSEQQEAWLYASDQSNSRLVEFDPVTLSETGIVIRDFARQLADNQHDLRLYWLLSADGSTLVEIQHAESTAGRLPTIYRIFDTRTGTLRSLITSFADGVTHIGRDGRYLVLDPFHGVMVSNSPEDVIEEKTADWVVYDTFSGKIVSEIRTQDPEPTIGLQGSLSADGTKMLFLSVPHTRKLPGPWSTNLVIYDLATGTEIARVVLPEVRAGEWDTGKRFEAPAGCYTDESGNPVNETFESPVTESLSPGLAVSPTGDRVAIVHADSNVVTLVDLHNYQVASSVAFDASEKATSVVDDICSESFTRFRDAAFSADGKSLFITGSELTAQDDDHTNFVDFGIKRLDLASGDVAEATAELPPNTLAHHRLLEPIGRELVVVDFRYPARRPYGAVGGTTVLRRLDAKTLDIITERQSTTHSFPILSPIEISPIAFVATPVPTATGAVTLSVGALSGDVESVRIVADGQVVFEGPILHGGVTESITGDHIVVTSSKPGYTVINRDGMPQTLMLSEKEEYP